MPSRTYTVASTSLSTAVIFIFAALTFAACSSGEGEGDGRIYLGGVLFGQQVALDSDEALVGALHTNEAFFLRHDGRRWRSAGRVRPTDSPLPDPSFGWQLAMRGGVAVVGAPERTIGATATGSAHVYEKNAGGWTLATVLRPDDLHPRARFGVTVGVSGERVVVGAPDDGINFIDPPSSTGWGTVHVFERSGGSWVRTARLENPSPTPGLGDFGDWFGQTLALDGDRLAVSSGSLAETGVAREGMVRVYEHDEGAWRETARLTHPDPDPMADNFGARLALSGPVLAGVAPSREEAESPGLGAVYVFREVEGTWVFEAKLRPPDLGLLDSYGWSLAVDGDRVAVGARGRERSRGSVFVYVRDGAGGWSLEEEVVPEGYGKWTSFGESVSLDGDRMLVGAIGIAGERGGVFEFRREEGRWRQVMQ